MNHNNNEKNAFSDKKRIIIAGIFGIVLGCLITIVTIFNIPNSSFWAIFGRYPSELTDFELQIRMQRDIYTLINNRIKALGDIDILSTHIVWPYNFENPITASIIINTESSSELAQNQAKMESIQNIIKYFFREIKDENIVIVDQNGFILNEN